ncbi:MAG: carboxymuconolactone decarboxylase family protein [Burkholderiaceae bacterium]
MTTHVPHAGHEPRIAPLEAPFEGELDALLAKMTPPGAPNVLALFRTLAKNPKLAERMMATGGHFLGKGSSLTMRDREIVIDRTCARCGAEYEWGVHVAAFAKPAGLSDAEVRATVTWPPSDAWAPNEAALIAMVDALHENSTVDDAIWAELARHYDEAQLIELVMLTGWYHAISFVCNALRVPLESWQARLPKAL